jgi:dienelactone hydrolase
LQDPPTCEYAVAQIYLFSIFMEARVRKYWWAGSIVLAVLASATVAQAPAGPAAQSQAAYEAMPDTVGTGPFPAVKLVEPSLPDHVVYRPADLARLGKRKLGVLVWGNGGCREDGASARLHLAEIASHGYLVVAPGKILTGPGAPAVSREPRAPDASGALPPVATTAADVLEGLDWALAENDRAGSPYYRRIDPAAVAVAGHSCGGLQAIQAGADPRIHTVIVHNSGIFADGSNPIRGVTVDKSMLRALHTPVLYVLGGRTDVAWPNGTDDFAKIDHVPAILASSDVGHGGTFKQANGGSVARIAADWLDWQLRGDARAGRTFSGPRCGLCTDPSWKVEKKDIR